MKKIYLLLCEFFPVTQLIATEHNPWFGNLFEFESRTSYLYQHYSQINTPAGSFFHEGNNHFGGLSLSISPWFDWNAESEIYFAKTSDTHFNFEKCKFTGRYLIWDDLLGDPLSLAVGFSLEGVNGNFLHDFAVFDHGEFEAECHIAIGKEIPQCFSETWAYHYWAVLGAGQANRGLPWVFGHIEGNINFNDCNELAIYSDLLFGLGSRNIHPLQHFHGYALIDHRSIDLGAFYRHYISNIGALTFDYCYRPYAFNAPQSAHTLKVTFLLPFGL